MRSPDRLARTVRYLDAQTRSPVHGAPPRHAAGPIITISREAGTGAHEIADRCAELLRIDVGAEWIVVDHDLVERVLSEHDLPARVAAAMPEDRVPAVADALSELFGVTPASASLVGKTAETILHLAAIGNVIVIGRAANVVIGRRWNACHVRLIGPLETRIAAIRRRDGLAEAAAARYIGETDAARRRYVRSNYRVDVTDPLGYDVVLNVERVTRAEAAQAIVAMTSARRAGASTPATASG